MFLFCNGVDDAIILKSLFFLGLASGVFSNLEAPRLGGLRGEGRSNLNTC